jgi:hypothetical protein
MAKSLFENVKVVMAVAPIAASAAQISAAIDTKGYHSGMVVVNNGAATGTPDSYIYDAKVQECATSGGSYTDITDAAIVQGTANGKSAQINLASLNDGTRLRYIKVVVTPAMTGGTSPKALISATVLLGRSEAKPVSNSATPA